MHRRITVLELRDTHEIGGPGKTILETFRAIDADRFQSHLAVFLTRSETGDTPFVRAARSCGMPTHFVHGINRYDPQLIWGLATLVKKLGVDIVHAHEVKSDAIAYLSSMLHGAAVVTTLHGWIGNSPKQKGLIALDRRLVRRFDAVIAVSRRIRAEAAEAGVQSNRLHLLHNAIVLDRYRRTGAKGFLRELLGRSVPSPIVVSVGRLSPEKGHVDLIEALAIAAARGHRFTTVLAGEGSERGRLLDRIHALGLTSDVHLVGHLDSPERVLEEADLAVLPSHTEGLPNAALEALVMEVPVLATRVGGTPEVVRDGETGRLVEPRDPEALAAALVEFAGDRANWKRLAVRGRELVERQFDFTSRTRALESVYTGVLESARR